MFSSYANLLCRLIEQPYEMPKPRLPEGNDKYCHTKGKEYAEAKKLRKQMRNLKNRKGV